MSNAIVFTNIYDLFCTIAERDPDACIEVHFNCGNNGMMSELKTSLILEGSDQYHEVNSQIHAMIVDAIDWYPDGETSPFVPSETEDFSFRKLRVTNDGLVAEAHWMIRETHEYGVPDIFAGEENVWGEKSTFHGLPDFDAIRQYLTWDRVFFDLELESGGQIKGDIELIDTGTGGTGADPRIEELIKKNWPTLEDALRQRLKTLGVNFIAEISHKFTEAYRLVWRSDDPYTIDIYDRLDAGICAQVFKGSIIPHKHCSVSDAI